MLSFSPTKLVISEFKIGHRKKSKKKRRESIRSLNLFFPTKWLYRLGIPIILSVLLNRHKNQEVFLLLSFLDNRSILVLKPYNHFRLSSPIKRFMYSSTLSSVILVPPNAAKKRSIKMIKKKSKPIHSQVVITNSPPNLCVLHVLKKKP